MKPFTFTVSFHACNLQFLGSSFIFSILLYVCMSYFWSKGALFLLLFVLIMKNMLNEFAFCIQYHRFKIENSFNMKININKFQIFLEAQSLCLSSFSDTYEYVFSVSVSLLKFPWGTSTSKKRIAIPTPRAQQPKFKELI